MVQPLFWLDFCLVVVVKELLFCIEIVTLRFDF